MAVVHPSPITFKMVGYFSVIPVVLNLQQGGISKFLKIKICNVHVKEETIMHIKILPQFSYKLSISFVL